MNRFICILLNLALLLQATGCTTLQPFRSYSKEQIPQYEPETGALVRLTVRFGSSSDLAGKTTVCRIIGFNQHSLRVAIDGSRGLNQNKMIEIGLRDIMYLEVIQKELDLKRTGLLISLAAIVTVIIVVALSVDFSPTLSEWSLQAGQNDTKRPVRGFSVLQRLQAGR